MGKAHIAGLNLGGKSYGFVNMYMFTTTLVLFIYSVFVQVCFSFLLCDEWRPHMLAKVNNLFSGQRPEVLLFREQQPCRVDKAYK